MFRREFMRRLAGILPASLIGAKAVEAAEPNGFWLMPEDVYDQIAGPPEPSALFGKPVEFRQLIRCVSAAAHSVRNDIQLAFAAELAVPGDFSSAAYGRLFARGLGDFPAGTVVVHAYIRKETSASHLSSACRRVSAKVDNGLLLLDEPLRDDEVLFATVSIPLRPDKNGLVTIYA